MVDRVFLTVVYHYKQAVDDDLQTPNWLSENIVQIEQAQKSAATIYTIIVLILA